MRPWKIFLGAAALAGGILLSPNTAGADVISGCFSKSAGSLRVVVSTDECKNNEIGITWNSEGAPGPAGPAGPAGPYPTSLPAGQTLRGTFAVEFAASSVNQFGTSAVSFPIPLPSAPSVVEIHSPGDPATAACPGSSGSPEAAAGAFCVYASSASNVGFKCVAKTGASYSCGEVESLGTSVFIASSGAGRTSFVGTWAVRSE